MDALPGFLIAAVALAGSPGPATLSLAATGAAFGVLRGMGYLVGLVAGMTAVMAVVASGLVGMLLAVPGAAPAVAGIAAVYFVWLAWRIATAPPLSMAGPQHAAPTFIAGFLLSLINPKGYAAMAALYSGFAVAPGRLVLDVAFKTALLLVVIAMVNVVWLLAGAALTTFFRDARTNRKINIAFALSLLASVGLALPF